MLVQPLTAGFFLEAANPVLWLSYVLGFWFFFSEILLKAWDGGGALVLITGPALSGMLLPLCFPTQGSQWDS